jgi:hypothetical protein
MTFRDSIYNVKTCVYSKTRSDGFKTNPSNFNLDFEIRAVLSKDGIKVPHLVAKDIDTGSFIYLCEVYGRSNQWVALDNQFRPKVYLFVNRILEELSYRDTSNLNAYDVGDVLVKIARDIYRNNT